MAVSDSDTTGTAWCGAADQQFLSGYRSGTWLSGWCTGKNAVDRTGIYSEKSSDRIWTSVASDPASAKSKDCLWDV